MDSMFDRSGCLLSSWAGCCVSNRHPAKKNKLRPVSVTSYVIKALTSVVQVSHKPNASKAKLQNSEDVAGVSGDTMIGDMSFGKNKGKRAIEGPEETGADVDVMGREEEEASRIF